MSKFLFKFFLKLASYFSADENWLDKQIHTESQLKIFRHGLKHMNRQNTREKFIAWQNQKEFVDPAILME